MVNLQEQVISFNLTNNTNGSIPMSIMGNYTDVMDNSNANTRYYWDLTGYSITTENSITIQYRYVGQSSFSTATVTFSGTSLQSVADALNTLNIGTFFLTTSGGSTYLNNYNLLVVYGSLSIVASTGIISSTFFVGTGFQTTPTSLLRQIGLQSSGKIITAGSFIGYQNNSQNNILRINTDGSFDTTFNSGGSGFNSFCDNIAIQSDDKIICVGQFATYNGVAVSGFICRLNSNGTIDNTYNVAGAGFNSIYAWSLALQSDGKLLVGGTFSSYNANAVGGIVRINTNGTYDNTFNLAGAGFSGGSAPRVYAIAVQPSDGKIICVGTFTSYNGTGANGIVRLNTNGTIDGTFAYGTGFTIVDAECIAIQSDGKILVGGNFSGYQGTTRQQLVRINTNGTIDLTFNTAIGFNGVVTNIALQSDGKIICTGQFTTYKGVTVNGIVRINTDASIDSTWNTSTGFNTAGTQTPIAIQSASNIIVGGQFTQFNGQTYNNIIGLLT